MVSTFLLRSSSVSDAGHSTLSIRVRRWLYTNFDSYSEVPQACSRFIGRSSNSRGPYNHTANYDLCPGCFGFYIRPIRNRAHDSRDSNDSCWGICCELTVFSRNAYTHTVLQVLQDWMYSNFPYGPEDGGNYGGFVIYGCCRHENVWRTVFVSAYVESNPHSTELYQTIAVILKLWCFVSPCPSHTSSSIEVSNPEF